MQYAKEAMDMLLYDVMPPDEEVSFNYFINCIILIA